MHAIEPLPFHPSILVSTMHVLKTGEIIESREGYEKVQDRFAWADRSESIHRLIKLRGLTDGGRKSLVVYYESGHLIKEFLNVELNFRPLAFV